MNNHALFFTIIKFIVVSIKYTMSHEMSITPFQISMTNWGRGNTYNYPADFEGILSEVTIYACPSSGKRVIISNGKKMNK